MSPMSHLIGIVGWSLLIVGVLFAILEPRTGRMLASIAGAIMIAGDHIADTIRNKDVA